MRPDSTQVKSSDESKICFINLLWNWAFISGEAQKGTIRYKKKNCISSTVSIMSNVYY